MRSTILSLALIFTAACGPVPFGSATDDQPLLSGPTVVAPTSGFGDPSTTTTIDAQGNVNWVGGSWYVPLPVSAGDVIGTVTAPVRDNGAANGHSSDGNNVLVNLISRTTSGDTSRAFWASNGSGNPQTATLAPSGGYTVQAGDEMLVVFSGLKGGALPGPSTVSSMSGAVTMGPATSIFIGTTINVPVMPATFPGPSAVSDISNIGPSQTSGKGFSIRGVPVGSMIINLRAKLADQPGLPVTLRLAAKEMAGTSAPTWRTIASHASSGSGEIQEVGLTSIGYRVPRFTELAAFVVGDGVSVSPAVTYIIELDYQ